MHALRRILEGDSGRAEVTDVTVKASWTGIVLLVIGSLASAQGTTPKTSSAESLYLQLQSVGLDSARVYRVRDGALDRGAVHISLDDGTIAFTQEAGGHITGALFRGDGELLLLPPNTVERASMALFTGAAILEERFSVAYFRFNDDVLGELQSSFRKAEDPDTFITDCDESARNLAQEDALRLLISFSKTVGGSSAPAGEPLLHAYIHGEKLGNFEVRYDSSLPEQTAVGQHKTVGGISYYDVWASFAQTKPQQGESDPDTGLFAWHDFDITQFKIRTAIKLPKDIESIAALSVVPRRNGSRILVFELSRLLNVQSVEANGSGVEFIHNQAVEGSQLAKRGNDVLAVFLPTPLRVGNSIELKIRYSGSVLSEAANGLLYVGEHGTWYPNVGFAMSSYDLEFRYPAGWTLVAVGRRTELTSEGGEQVSRWVSDRKLPVAGFNLGKYSHIAARAGGVDVETYATSNVEKGFVASASNDTLPIPLLRNSGKFPIAPEPPLPSPSRNLQMVSDTAAQALEFYSRKFGSYPYSELALTQFPGRVSQGWPGLIFLSSYAFLSPQESEHTESDVGSRLELEQVVAHETAHQWWGDLVTWSGYRDQWIMEALANYSALMLLESKNPAGFKQLMMKYRDHLLAKSSTGSVLMDSGPVTLGVRLSSSQFPQGYPAISYGRGTWLFHMLRTMLRDSQRTSSGQAGRTSDELFVHTLQKLRTEYEGRSINTAQLMAVFEEELPKSLWYEGKKSLDWFYESWLNGTAVPQFELRDVKVSEQERTTLVSGVIVQNHAPDTLVTAVPLYASVGGKTVFLRRVFAEGHESAFRISAPAGARKILLDPEQTLLSRGK